MLDRPHSADAKQLPPRTNALYPPEGRAMHPRRAEEEVQTQHQKAQKNDFHRGGKAPRQQRKERATTKMAPQTCTTRAPSRVPPLQLVLWITDLPVKSPTDDQANRQEDIHTQVLYICLWIFYVLCRTSRCHADQ